MDHAGWMEAQLSFSRKHRRKGDKPAPEQLSEFQRRVVNIIGIVGCGIYNAPISAPERIDWNWGGGVSMVWKKDLGTFDFDALTRLVFLCHEARIRCDIATAGPVGLRLGFWQRRPEGSMAERHPNLEEAVAGFRTWFPADHQIAYREAKAPVEVGE